MKLTNMILAGSVLTLGILSAAPASYEVTLRETVSVGTTQLKPGDYKVEMQGDKAVFKSGKNVVEIPATVATNDKKYLYTSLQTTASQLIEIDLAGTKSKILFGADAPATAGTK